MLLTNRKYQITILELGEIGKPFTINFESILCLNLKNNECAYEYIYALQDMGDEVLDLKIGDSLYFQPIRDNKATKAIIVRIK